jgi:hypothetical protein
MAVLSSAGFAQIEHRTMTKSCVARQYEAVLLIVAALITFLLRRDGSEF